MTADQLTEKLIELRRRHKARAEEHEKKTTRIRAIAEEMQGLGCDTSHQAKHAISDMDWDVQNSALNEGVDLLREFLGLAQGVRF